MKTITLIAFFLVCNLVLKAQNYKLFLNGPTFALTQSKPSINFQYAYRYSASGYPGATAPYVDGCGKIIPDISNNSISSYTSPFFNSGTNNYGIKNNVYQQPSSVRNIFGVVVNNVFYNNYDVDVTSIATYNYKFQNKRICINNVSADVSSSCSISGLGDAFFQSQPNYTYTKDVGSQYAVTVAKFEWMLASEICLNADPLDLRLFISGLEGMTGTTFSGPGVNGNVFTPASAGVGTWQLIATKTYDNGVAIKYVNITVNDYNRESYFDVPTKTFCSDITYQNMDELTTGHPNGTWSNNKYLGSDGKNFSISLAQASDQTISYTWANAKGCKNTQSFTFTIAPAFIISAGGQKTCDNQTLILTGGSPSGGVWSSSRINPDMNPFLQDLLETKMAGLAKDTINVGLAGSPTGTTYYIQYTVNKLGCIKSFETYFYVFDSPKISFTETSRNGYDAVKDICSDAVSYNLLSGTKPKGGIWTTSQDLKTVLKDSILDITSAYDIITNRKNPPNPNYAAFTYKAVKGNCFSTKTKAVNIIKIPDAPITTGGSNCGPASFTLKAVDPGINKTVTWHETISTPIVLVTGLTYLTSTINTTQTFYAQIKDNISGCISPRTPTLISIYPIPIVNAGQDQSVCQNVSTLAVTGGSPSSNSNGGTGVWSGGSYITSNGTFSTSQLDIGSYDVTYTYTNSFGCFNSGVKKVTVKDYPSVLAGPQNYICGNVGNFKLSDKGESPSGGSWSIVNKSFKKALTSDTLNTDSLIAGNTFDVKYTYTNTEGCSNFISRKVTIYVFPTKPVLAGAKACGANSLTLLASGAESATQESYKWYATRNSTFPFNTLSTYVTPSLDSSRTYYVSKVNLYGCEGKKDSVRASINFPTPVEIGGDFAVCKTISTYNLNQELSIKGGKFTTGNNALIKNDSLFDVSGATVGNYTLLYTYTNKKGCISTDSKLLTVSNNPVLRLNKDTSICEKTPVFTLFSNPSGGVWTGTGVDSAGTFKTDGFTSGMVQLNYNYNKGGCSVAGTMFVTINKRPEISTILGKTSSCENDTLVFDGKTSNPTGIRFNWYKNNDSIPFTIANTIKVRNKNIDKILIESVNLSGCKSLTKTEEKISTFYTTGDFSVNPTSIMTDQYSHFQSDIKVSDGDAILEYDWNFGDSSSHASAMNAYHYYIDTGFVKVTLKIKTTQNCKLSIVKNKAVYIKGVPIRLMTFNGTFPLFYEFNNDNVISVYPNPSTGIFTFSCYNNLYNIEAEIQDLSTGKTVFKSNGLTLSGYEFNLTNEKSGMYILTLKDRKGEKKRFKLIKS